jgi:hypothetical protein
MMNLLIQISILIMGIRVFFFLWGWRSTQVPGHRVKTQLLVEVIQGQSQPKLEMSIPDNNNDRRHSLRSSELQSNIEKTTKSSMWSWIASNIRENYNLRNLDKYLI